MMQNTRTVLQIVSLGPAAQGASDRARKNAVPRARASAQVRTTAASVLNNKRCSQVNMIPLCLSGLWHREIWGTIALGVDLPRCRSP